MSPRPTGGQQQRPHCAPGDEVYLHHRAGPVRARVLSSGEHGITAKVGDKQHRVKWDKVLGHHSRAELAYQIEEEGEDGMVVRDAQGRRHYMAIPAEAREGEQLVVKSLGGARVVRLGRAP